MKKGAKFIVQGAVQGVFFRKFAQETAEALSLKGYVRNLSNGDVEVAVEGDAEHIDSYEQRLMKGPPHAQIRRIVREDRKWDGAFKEFKILRI